MIAPLDVIVIGAGPGGGAAAITLARRGLHVAIVESKPFPRVKVCGEYVSPAATDALELLLDAQELRSAGAKRVDLYAIELGDRSIEWRTPRGAWSLSRASLDDLLVAKARDVGVEVLQPSTVRKIQYEDDVVEVAISTRAEPIRSRVVIHADGVGRFDHGARTTPKRPGVLGVKCHFAPPPGEPIVGVRMRACRGAYIGTVSVERGLATCAMTVREEILARFVKDTRFSSKDEALDAMTRELWPGFARCARTTEWLTCGVAGSGYIEPGHARSFRVGNAAAAIEPVGGEGIGLALWSGVMLGAALDLDALARTRREYGRAYRRRIRVRRPVCRIAAEALSRPALVRAIWPALESPGSADALIRAFWTLSGKPA